MIKKVINRYMKVVLVISLIAVLSAIYLIRTNPMYFVRHWSKVFSEIESYEEATAFFESEDCKAVWKHEFDNGEWVIAISQCACSGFRGKDVTVFSDSTGAVFYQLRHHFCGYEGLSCELNQIATTNLFGFYSELGKVVDLKVMRYTVTERSTRVQ